MKGLGKMNEDIIFNQRQPHIIVVDNFYKDPDSIVETTREFVFKEENKFYKGKRTTQCLFPYVKEEFERLLNVEIIDWLNQPMNGVFQITEGKDPLVWHSDSQDYAAAIYLTKDGPTNAGTSFWKDKKYGCRRPPSHPLENKEGIKDSDIYTEYNLTHEDNWELVDRVGSAYNRLVIWDGKMIHSATMYGEFSRLVHLFFFNVKK
jgi:hypothetical protein